MIRLLHYISYLYSRKTRAINTMPGLINRHTRVPMSLQATRVSAVVNGLSVGITASLTYFNDEDHVVEGVFCLGLSEDASVTGFEARMSTARSIHVHVKDKTEVDHFDEILTGTSGSFSHGSVPPGRFAVTEFDSGRVFCANLGTIRPHGAIVVMLSISTLMTTSRVGQVQFQLPQVFTPRIKKENTLQGTEPESKTPFPDSQHGAMKSILDIVEETGINASAYDFEFQLEVKAPTLLAGVSSKTHAIRVDADPYATDASDVFITLAEPHPMDRSLEITLHFPRPHVPVVILEHGDMSPGEYENFVRLEREYLHTSGATEDDNKKTYMQKRMHKDIMHNAVAMLNYCADFEGLTKQMLQHTFDIQGEYIFVIDRSGSMSGEYIANGRETLMMFLKSLPVSCRFNIVGFGTSYKALFDCSRLYTQENVSEASSYIRRMRADMGGTNLLTPLEWILHQPTTRGWPRQLFVVTDGGVSNTSEILELVRINAVHTRVHTFGVGENVSKRLVRGIAQAGRGVAEYIATGERMQSKVMNTLKKALQPVISDISLDWTLPGGVEVLQTPANPSPIKPGEPLVIYGLLCDTVRMHATLASVLQKGERRNPFGANQSLSRNSSTDRMADRMEGDEAGDGASTPASVSRSPVPSPKPTALNDKVLQFTQPKNQYTNGLSRPSPSPSGMDCSTKANASDPGDDADSSESTTSRPLSSAGQTAQKRYMELAARRARAISVPDNRMAMDPLSIQQLLLKLDSADRRHSEYQTHPGAGRGRTRFRRTPTDCCSTASDASEPISPSWDNFLDGDQDEMFDSDVHISLSDAVVLDDGKLINLASRSTQCFVTISGLFCGRPISCEVPFDISTLIRGEWTGPSGDDEVWEETIHQLAAKCLLYDYDVSAKKSDENDSVFYGNEGTKRSLSDMPTDEAFKIRAQMIEVSQVSHVVCRHTAFVSVDQETLEPLPSPIQVLMPKPKTRAQVRRQLRHIGFTKGLGRRISSSLTDSEDDAFSSGFGRSDSLSSCQSHPIFQSTEVPEFKEPTSVWSSVDPNEWSATKMYDIASNSKSKAWHLGSRLSKLRSRLSTMPSKRPLFRAIDIMECGGRTLSMECVELYALVNLQLAYGGWQLDQDLADALDISLDRLKRSSPLCMIMTKVLPVLTPEGSRQSSLDFPGRKSPMRTPEGSRQSSLDFPRRLSPEGRQESEVYCPSGIPAMPKRSDSSLSSCTEFIAVPDRTIPILRSPVEVSFKESGSPITTESGYHGLHPCYSPDTNAMGSLTYNPNEFPMRRKLTDFVGLCRVSTDDDPTGEMVENRLWATVLSLVWLEHNCGSFFNEWELLAAKADRWLSEQRLPRGFDIPSLKAAAYQVIVLSRK